MDLVKEIMVLAIDTTDEWAILITVTTLIIMVMVNQDTRSSEIMIAMDTEEVLDIIEIKEQIIIIRVDMMMKITMMMIITIKEVDGVMIGFIQVGMVEEVNTVNIDNLILIKEEDIEILIHA